MIFTDTERDFLLCSPAVSKHGHDSRHTYCGHRRSNKASNNDQKFNERDSADELPPMDVQSVASKYETIFTIMIDRFKKQQVEVNTIRDQLEKRLSVILNRFTVLELASASLNDRLDTLDNCLTTAISDAQNLDQECDLMRGEQHKSEHALSMITSKFENLEDEVVEIGGQLDAVKDDFAMNESENKTIILLPCL